MRWKVFAALVALCVAAPGASASGSTFPCGAAVPKVAQGAFQAAHMRGYEPDAVIEAGCYRAALPSTVWVVFSDGPTGALAHVAWKCKRKIVPRARVYVFPSGVVLRAGIVRVRDENGDPKKPAAWYGVRCTWDGAPSAGW